MKDGVYIGLPHEVYLASRSADGKQKRRGSTDWTRLYSRGRGWWWESEHNPFHVPESTKATIFGTALHAVTFEGMDAYNGRFAVMPNQRDYPDLLVTADDLRSALIAKGAPGIKAKMAKNDLVQLGKAYLDGRHIWDDIVERWERGLKGRTALPAADHFAIMAMYQNAIENPEARVIMGADEEVRLSELSILYTPADGIPRRYRLDSMLPTANVDLKSFADWRGNSTPEYAIGDLIAKQHLDIQLAMSHEARIYAYRLIEAGQIFAPSAFDGAAVQGIREMYPAEREVVAWLERFPKEAPLNGGDGPGWCFAWLFYQKPEGGAAPELIPVRVGYGDDVHRNGWRKYQQAVHTYQENVHRFGLDKPWVGVSALYDTSPRFSRRIQLPPWSDQAPAVPGEEEALSWR